VLPVYKGLLFIVNEIKTKEEITLSYKKQTPFEQRLFKTLEVM
jgi:hypothetical protein